MAVGEGGLRARPASRRRGRAGLHLPGVRERASTAGGAPAACRPARSRARAGTRGSWGSSRSN